MPKKQMSLAQLKNLPQYQGKTDEELERIRDRIIYGDTDTQVEAVIKSFEEDYDLSGMTANDKLALLELARIFVSLDRIQENIDAELEADDPNVVRFEKLTKIASQMRVDASKLQHDLNITRRARQDAGGQTVPEFLSELQQRAKQFLADRLCEIYCPECNMLLAKVWFLYGEKDNTIKLACGREGCENIFEVTSCELLENKGKNVKVGPPR
jgi:hypothetical protein